jgi:hypothetical protein
MKEANLSTLRPEGRGLLELRAPERANKNPPLQRKTELEFLTI